MSRTLSITLAAFLALGLGAASAQTPPALKTPPAQPAAPAPAPQTPPKSETTTFDFWTVTCDNQGAAPAQHRCIARLNVQKSKDDRQLILILAVIKGKTGEWQLLVQTPTTIILKDGAQLTLGKNPTRRLTYTSCEPALCTAEVTIDPALQQELTSSDGAKVTFTSMQSGAAWVEFGLKGAKGAYDYLTKQ